MSEPYPWTFAAGGEVTEQLTWLTDVLQAATGPSQHRRLRTAPRTVLKFNGLESGRRRRWLESLLYAHGAKRWDAPLVMDTARLSTALPAATDTILLDTSGRRFVAGGHALLMQEDPAVFERVQIATVGGSRLTLSTVTAWAWPAGTRVLPLRTARLQAVPSLSRFTGDAAPYQVEFRLEAPLEWPANAGPATYRALPVLEIPPTWSTDPEWAPERPLSHVDNEVGIPAVFDRVGIPLGRQAMPYALVGPAALAAFRGLLFALCGRWGTIWVPTWAQDLQLVNDVPNGATTLDVEGPLLSATGLAINRRDVRIQLANGTVLYRRLTAAAAHSATVERLTLDVAIATGFAASAVASVSFMALCRQDTDVNLLRHWSHEVVLSELSFRAVANDV